MGVPLGSLVGVSLVGVSLVGVSLVGLACEAARPPAREPIVTPPVSIAISDAASAPAASRTPCVPPTPRTWWGVKLDAGSPGLEPNAAALASAGAAVRATCKTLEATNKQRRSAIYGTGPGPFGLQSRGEIAASTRFGCFAGAKGAWVLEHGAFHRSTSPAEPGEVATWTLVYVAPDAKRITSKDARGRHVMMLGEGESTAQIYGAFDFDGDGVDEVFVAESSIWSIDGQLRTEYRGYRLRNGGIEAWDPVPKEHVRGWRDVDGDVHPDLFLGNVDGMDVIAHARPDGTFSLDDEVTRSVRHASCVGQAHPTPACAPYVDAPPCAE